MVESPFLEVSKERVNVILRDMVLWATLMVNDNQIRLF